MPTFEFTSPEGKTYSVEGPEGATKEQAFQILQQQIGATAGGEQKPQAPQEGFVSDVAKSAGAGLAQGTATAIGLPGDLATLAHAVAPQGVVDAVKAVPGAKWLYNHLPGSQAVLDSADQPLVDPNYQPQYTAGRYTKALASNAGPGLAMGMGPLAVGAGAVAGQAAEDATGSKVAGAIGNVAGSIAAPLALARATRQAMAPMLTAAQIKDVANSHYADPLLKTTKITPQAAKGVAQDMSDALANARSKFAPAQAPNVHGAINNLANSGPKVGPAAPVSIEDLHSFRKTLGQDARKTIEGKPTEEAAAAMLGRRVLDKYLDNIPSKDIVNGNPIDAVNSLRQANGNWNAYNGAAAFERLIDDAGIKAAGRGSGMNFGNTMRQAAEPLLLKGGAKLKAMGATPEAIAAVRRVSEGDPLTNFLRMSSNMLGGGGGIGAVVAPRILGGTVGASEGYHQGGIAGGIAGGLAGMAPGIALRLATNRLVLKHANEARDALLAKAPINAAILARNNAAKAANSAAYSSAVAKNGIPNILLQVLGLQGG